MACSQGCRDGVRRAVLTLVAAAFVAAFFVANELLRGRPAPSLETRFDRAIPLWPPAVAAYALVYFVVFVPVFEVRDLRLFARAVLAFCAYNSVALVFFFALPTHFPRPEGVAPDSFFSWCLALVYRADPGYNNFPSLHVANATFVAFLAWRVDRAVGAVMLALAAGIAVSTLLVKQHWIADVVSGGALGYAACRLGVWPAIARGGPRREIAFPRACLLILVAFYGLMVGGLAIAYAS